MGKKNRSRVPGTEELMRDEILTVSEVAKYFKIDDKIILSMVQKGQLPAFKIGGEWRIERGDIYVWIGVNVRNRPNPLFLDLG